MVERNLVKHPAATRLAHSLEEMHRSLEVSPISPPWFSIFSALLSTISIADLSHAGAESLLSVLIIPHLPTLPRRLLCEADAAQQEKSNKMLMICLYKLATSELDLKNKTKHKLMNTSGEGVRKTNGTSNG